MTQKKEKHDQLDPMIIHGLRNLQLHENRTRSSGSSYSALQYPRTNLDQDEKREEVESNLNITIFGSSSSNHNDESSSPSPFSPSSVSQPPLQVPLLNPSLDSSEPKSPVLSHPLSSLSSPLSPSSVAPPTPLQSPSFLSSPPPFCPTTVSPPPAPLRFFNSLSTPKKSWEENYQSHFSVASSADGSGREDSQPQSPPSLSPSSIASPPPPPKTSSSLETITKLSHEKSAKAHNLLREASHVDQSRKQPSSVRLALSSSANKGEPSMGRSRNHIGRSLSNTNQAERSPVITKIMNEMKDQIRELNSKSTKHKTVPWVSPYFNCSICQWSVVRRQMCVPVSENLFVVQQLLFCGLEMGNPSMIAGFSGPTLHIPLNCYHCGVMVGFFLFYLMFSQCGLLYIYNRRIYQQHLSGGSRDGV